MRPAVGHPSPVWPLPDVEPRLVATYGGKSFGATRPPRNGRQRKHAGVDILAARGALVIAPEDGRIVATQTFNGPFAHALLFETDTGLVLLFGEVEPESWSEFGLQRGSVVRRGEPLARVGVNPGGSTMLHFETYTQGTRQNARWWADGFPPSNLLDPTPYLEAATAGEPVSPVETDDHGHDDDDDDHVTTEPPMDDELDDITPGRYEDDPAGGHSWNWAATDRGWTNEQMREYWGNDPAYNEPYSVERPDDVIPACRQAGGEFVEPNLCRFPNGHTCRAYDVNRVPGCPPGFDEDEVEDTAPSDETDEGEGTEDGGDLDDPFPWIPDVGPPGEKGLGIIAVLLGLFLLSELT